MSSDSVGFDLGHIRICLCILSFLTRASLLVHF